VLRLGFRSHWQGEEFFFDGVPKGLGVLCGVQLYVAERLSIE
jgi:hypothetical protein